MFTLPVYPDLHIPGEWIIGDGTTYTKLFTSGPAQYTIVSNAAGSYYIGQEYGGVTRFDGVERTPLTTLAFTNYTWGFAQRAERIWLAKGYESGG